MSDLLYAEFSNAQEVFAGFGEARALLAKPVIAYEIAEILEDALRAQAPKGCTGKLREGIEAKPVIEPAGFTVEITSAAPYTDLVIKGRGPVRPVRAKVLHWKTCSGEDVFSMYSGPVEPNPFHYRGWQIGVAGVVYRWVSYGGEIAGVLAT